MAEALKAGYTHIDTARVYGFLHNCPQEHLLTDPSATAPNPPSALPSKRAASPARKSSSPRNVSRGLEPNPPQRVHPDPETFPVWNNSHHPDDVEPALDASLADLGTDYVDLYLMHWPVAFARGESMFPRDSNGKMINGDTDYVDTWRAMEKAFKKGKAKAIGISNFSRKETERLLQETEVVPAAHQIEVHPYLQQNEVCAWYRSKGIHVQQYSP